MCIMAMTKIHTALIRLLNLTNFEYVIAEQPFCIKLTDNDNSITTHGQVSVGFMLLFRRIFNCGF